MPIDSLLPAMFVLSLIPVLAGITLLIMSIRRVTPTHSCVACGYDLRHVLSASQACPECGEPIRRQASSIRHQRRLFVAGVLLVFGGPVLICFMLIMWHAY